MKRRAWNSTLPAPTKPMKRTGFITKVSGWFKPKKKKPSPAEQSGLTYGRYHKWVGRKPCCIRGRYGHDECFGPVTGHHLKHVGSGGEDYRNEVPLCWGAHTLSPFSIHALGPTVFNQTYQVDVWRVAQQLGDMWDAKEAKRDQS